MCVAAPNIQGLQRFRRPSAAASTHVCVAEIRVAPRGRSFIKALPTNCCCEHTRVCCRVGHLRVAPKVRPTNCYCEHTHVCFKKMKSRRSQWSKCYKGSAEKILLLAYAQGFTHGSTVTRDCPTICCCGHTHVCCRIHQRRVAPRVKVYAGLADQVTHGSYTCVLQNVSIQGCTQESRVTTEGRPVAAASIHMCVCVAEYINQGLHQRTKDYKGLTDQLLLRAHTHTPRELQNTPIQDCTRGSRVTKVWPTTCCCEHTHACCRVSQFKVATRSFTGLATNCFCEHTDVCCRKYQFRPAPRT